MKFINGDLIELAKQGKFDVIVHGCNCFNTMGAGIAKLIRYEYPKAYEIDKHTKRGDANKLGSYTRADIIQQIKDGNGYRVHDLIVINAYTQYDYKWHNGEPPIDYHAIDVVFRKLNRDFKGNKVGIPMIGAGLAGGDWDAIEKIIENAAPNLEITVVVYNNTRSLTDVKKHIDA